MGFPQPDVKWLKNGEELISGANLNITQDLNRVKLTISSVSASDAGKYTCTASNSAGSASCTADLVVKKTVFPPVMGRRLQASARTVGERIVMEIEVMGTPDPEVKWYKDGQQIPASSSMFELRHYGNCHALVIEKATQSHSGKYTACAVNSAGESKSTADLLVQQPQLPMDIIEQTTTNITSSHEVIHHPQPMKSIENLKSSESLYKDSHKELFEKSMKASNGSAKEIHLGDTVSVIETVKTDKQVSLKLSHSSGSSSWSDDKLEFSSYGKKTPIPIIESPLPFHPPAPYLKEEITTITPEMQQIHPAEKEIASEDKSTIEESHIAKKDALNFFKNIITENKMEEQKLNQQMTRSSVGAEPRLAFKEPLISQEYSKTEQSSTKSFEQQMYQSDSLFDLEPGPPPEMGFIPKTPTTVLKKEDVFERVKKLEESHRTLADEEIPTGAVKIFPSSGKSEPSVSAISSSIPVTLQAAAAFTPSMFMPENFNTQFQEKSSVSSKKEVFEEVIVPEKVEPAGSDEKTTIKKSHFLENSSNFESSLSPVFRPQADISVRPQSPRPSAEAVSMEKLWTSRQKETVEISQSSQGMWKPSTPEPVQQPAWKPSPPVVTEQLTFKAPSPEPVKEPLWKPVQPPEQPVWKPVVSPAPTQPFVKPTPQPATQPAWKQTEPTLPPWQSAPPEPHLRSSSPLPSAEAVAMEKLWSHKHSESSLKTVWPPPLPTDLKQQAPWVEKIKTDMSEPVSEVQTVNVEKEQKSFSHTSYTEKVSKETKSFSSQSKTEQFSSNVSHTPSFIPQKPKPPPPVVDSPKIIYVAEAHASHSMNLPSQQVTNVSEISTSSISKSEFSETIENVSNVVEERTLKPSEAKALWDSTPKTQDSYVPPPKKVQPKETKPFRPYSAHELNFDDLHLEPGPPPEMGFAQPPALDRRLSQIELIEQDLEKDSLSPGSSLASGLSPGGVNAGASPVVNPSTVPEHARKAPLFITPLRNIAVLTGNAARFECIVQAEPAPNILWAHDGRILQPSEMHNIEFRNGVCRLTMPKAELSDAGTYTCTATNLLGTSGTTASLQVSGERRSLLV
ncbi:hypothetical protein LSTR_LSTR013425 [Laodelphax striatellus]|uniref:Ig-like domain-containing protein n=1 Tax=Laodelphax striatellus TaxID=195883 RepID=A0A482XDL9_LAOST|nr:hypothetical protein LSTR_LSTR013425 [Laodelphax striatellus]